MKLIHRAQRGGKTTELLRRMLLDPELVYVAPTVQQAEGAWRQATALNHGVQLNRARFKGAHQYTQYGRYRKVVVDELEATLNTLLGNATIEAVTFSGPIDGWRNPEKQPMIEAEWADASEMSVRVTTLDKLRAEGKYALHLANFSDDKLHRYPVVVMEGGGEDHRIYVVSGDLTDFASKVSSALPLAPEEES